MLWQNLSANCVMCESGGQALLTCSVSAHGQGRAGRGEQAVLVALFCQCGWRVGVACLLVRFRAVILMRCLLHTCLLVVLCRGAKIREKRGSEKQIR
jgi:hypothetical protein